MIKRKTGKWIYLLLVLSGSLLMLSACAGKAREAEGAGQTEAAALNGTVKTADGETEADQRDPGELLSEMTQAIELQFPQQEFTELQSDKADVFFRTTGNAYLYSVRESSEGWSYIAAVKTVEENPFEGMSCANGTGIEGYSFSQFDGSSILFLESRPGSPDADGAEVPDSGLSYVYEALQKGEQGIDYLKEAGERGASVVPPVRGPFMKVSMITEGGLTTEFVPLTEQQGQELNTGESVGEERFLSEGLRIFGSREELTGNTDNTGQPVTQEMIRLAEERCGFEAPMLTDIENIVSARLSVSLYGETREETLENREDLERITDLLRSGMYKENVFDRKYEGDLTLTRQDGQEITIQLAAEDGGFVLGNSVCCGLSGEDTQKIWSVFTMVEGFRRYGESVSLEMTQDDVTAETDELRFTLINHTGGSIHYSLSPLLYRKSMENGTAAWKQIEMTGGFCGTNDLMKGEREELSIPWKGIFKLEGPGTYRVEIVAAPEEQLRFPVQAEFELGE